MKKLSFLAVFVLAAALPAGQAARAQVPEQVAASTQAAERHVQGLRLEQRGDDKGAFSAFLEAAEGGYAPAQRRLGEIYDIGNSAVKRNYEESIRWYEKARAGGERIPPLTSPIPSFSTAP